MIAEISGPRLRQRVERECFRRGEFGGCKYEYIDHAGNRQPEYAATHIRIRAFFARMNPTLLDDLSDRLAGMTGCVSTAKIPDHPKYRPLVVAIFDRQAAA